jgi:hypothetical protein
MSTPNDPIRLSQSDLYSPQVESYLQVQESLRRDVGPLETQPLVVRVLYASWFYLMIATGLGAFTAWLIIEPFYNDSDIGKHEGGLISLLVFPTVAATCGLFLGAAEGTICRNPLRAAISGLVGLGVGFGGGLISIFPAGIVFVMMAAVAMSMPGAHPGEHATPTGIAFLMIMMGRGAAWALAAIPAGLGQGIALREKKVMANGVIGAVLGGLLGGVLFDPIGLLTPEAEEAYVSRGVGFTLIGMMVGLFVGLVESWTKTAWLLMRAGPLAGKQFVLFRVTTVLGSSPKAEVYLFKDEAIEPRHAVVYNRGGRFEIEDCGTKDGTYVNGVPISRTVLQSGDKVVLGKTVLEFLLKESH